jgi:DNA-binding response OmpR family regulator
MPEQPIKILLVEDERPLREALADALATAADRPRLAARLVCE